MGHVVAEKDSDFFIIYIYILIKYQNQSLLTPLLWPPPVAQLLSGDQVRKSLILIDWLLKYCIVVNVNPVKPTDVSHRRFVESNCSYFVYVWVKEEFILGHVSYDNTFFFFGKLKMCNRKELQKAMENADRL